MIFLIITLQRGEFKIIFRPGAAACGRNAKKIPRAVTARGILDGGGDGSRTHVRKEFSAGVSGCRRSTTFPPRHADRQASALVAS